VETRRTPRIAMITMGQAPRPDVMQEIGPLLGEAEYDEFGALDNDPDALIARMAPRDDELSYLTQLRDGRHVILEAGFVTSRTEALVAELDGRDYDLLILAMTGMRARLSTRVSESDLRNGIDWSAMSASPRRTSEKWTASTVASNRAAIRKARSREGSCLPLSRALTAWRETPSRWPSSACVQPCCWRSSRSRPLKPGWSARAG